MLLCDMKRHTIILTIAAFTFIFGVFITAFWFHKSANVAVSDSTVYSVSFCELCKNPTLYDGKIVRTQAVYSLFAESSHLYDLTCKASMQLGCAATANQCNEMFNRLREAMRSRLPKVKIEFVGRYNVHIDKAPLIEMLELKSV